MKYFILMSSFLLFAFAAKAEFVRQEQRPDYFIPEKEIVKTPAFVVEPQRPNNGSAETIAHISAKDNSVKKIPQRQIMTTDQNQEIGAARTQEDTRGTKMKIPHFQKKYDEYHKDILTMKNSKRLPSNPQLKEDLSKMSGEERFEVPD